MEACAQNCTMISVTCRDLIAAIVLLLCKNNIQPTMHAWPRFQGLWIRCKFQQAKKLIKMQLEIDQLKQIVMDLQLQSIELETDCEDKISAVRDYVNEELRC